MTPENISLNETPINLRPALWLDQLKNNGMPIYGFYIGLMNCIQSSEVGPALKYLPANLFEDFKETLMTWAGTENEEDFVIVGSSPAPWGLRDVWRVIQWLEANPNPELAAPVENVE